jgi:hypothetical protein
MKFIKSQIVALLCGVVSLSQAFGQLNSPPNRNPGFTEAVDYFGDHRLVWDWNKDGWDDLWVGINYRDVKPPFDTTVDCDGDGVTDYHEMLLWRCPWTKGPLPKKLSPEEQQQAAIEAEKQAKIQFEIDRKKWAEHKQFLEKFKGVAPADEEEHERKRIEDAKKALEEIQKLPSVEGFPSEDSSEQISHADLTNFQLSSGDWLKLFGEGQTIAVGEINPPVSLAHPDFGGRVSTSGYTLSNGYLSNAPTNSHGVMTSSVIASSGVSNSYAKGLASKANVVISPSITGLHKISRWGLMSGFNFSAHPYAVDFWSEDAKTWPIDTPSDNTYYLFQSRPDVTLDEPNFAGMYTSDTAFIDAVIRAAPEHLYVQSASNTRMMGLNNNDFPLRFINDGNGPTGSDGYFIAYGTNNELYLDQSQKWPYGAGYKNGGRDSLPSICVAKNALVVGGVTGTNNPSPGSGWGPTDDGRIKPDLVSLSYDVTVAESHLDGSIPNNTTTYDHGYTNSSGTSFSTPAVAAGAALIAEARKVKSPKKFKAATIKAILLATATDVGAAGPDPETGWGIMNAGRAATLVVNDKNSTLIREATVFPTGQGQPVLFQVKTKATDPGVPGGASNLRLKVFICWDDPAFVPNPSTLGTVDEKIKTLVNDLNLVVNKAGDTNPYEPVALNTTGSTSYTSKTFVVNTKDNVEQVEIYEDGTFNIVVQPNGTITGPQPVSIVVQGADLEFVPTPGGGVPPANGAPPQVPPPSINRTGVSEFTITWPSIAGRTYDIETSTDLLNWTPSTLDIKANSYYTSYAAPALGERGFYRVIDVEDPEVILPPIYAGP